MANPHKKLQKLDNSVFRVAVKALILDGESVLIIKDDSDNDWGFPGGGIDYGEDVRTALERELHEEVAIPFGSFKSIPKLVHVSAGHVKQDIPRVNIFYFVDVDPSLIKLGPDAKEIKWISIKDELDAVVWDPAHGDPTKVNKILKSALS